MNQAETTLSKIGKGLQQQALNQPGQPFQVRLKRGLFVMLLFRPPKWQLSLVRENVYPATAEVKAIRQHFGFVPAGARQEQLYKRSGAVLYYITRLIWFDVEQLPLTGVL